MTRVSAILTCASVLLAQPRASAAQLEPAPAAAPASDSARLDEAAITAVDEPDDAPDSTVDDSSGEPDPASSLHNRLQLLERAYHAVALEETHHERLIEGYQRGLQQARRLADDHYIDLFLLGLARAHALALSHLGSDSYAELLSYAVDELILRILCRRDVQQDDDDVQLSEARLLRRRHVPTTRPWPTCPGTSAPAPAPPPVAVGQELQPTPVSPRPKRELALIGSGAVAVAGGTTSVLLGALGKVMAESSGRLLSPPSPEQAHYLDEQLPRRRAIWIGVGSVVLLAGVAMLAVGGHLLARHRRAIRSSDHARSRTSWRNRSVRF
jgi:hypothetical protein